MLVTILSWSYMAYVCLIIGFGVMGLLEKILQHPFSNRKGFHYIIAGIAAITVYVEYFSLVYKIGMAAHLLLLLGAVFLHWCFRKTLGEILKRGLRILFSWEGFFYFGVILVISFFASRGEFHTDTGIYHGQAIRWYEEYGAVKGLGNLQLHFAYNSAYLAFASIFSLFWLFGISLHTTTGLLAMVLCVYACRGLKGVWKRRLHIADLCRLGILIYLLNILCRSMSPATDFGTLMIALYLLLRWAELYETKGGIQDYGLLCLLAVFVVTLKLSTVSLLLLTCFPAWHLVRGKEWRRIGGYVLLGTLILLPWLLRNVILSGWLIYPFAGIDLFSFDWKIPREYVEIDSAKITVWAKCLYNIKKIYAPLGEWIPIWWEAQTYYGQMLIYANVAGTILAGFLTVWKIKNHKKSFDALTVLYLTLFASIFLWFLMAPFIRYGLAFLLTLPLLAVGEAFSFEQKGLARIFSGVLAAGIFFSISPFWDNYIADAGVFVKHNIKAPYYILPKDYEHPATQVMKMGKLAVYIPVGEEEYISYYDFPGSCYADMIERSEMRGASMEEGFRAIQ